MERFSIVLRSTAYLQSLCIVKIHACSRIQAKSNVWASSNWVSFFFELYALLSLTAPHHPFAIFEQNERYEEISHKYQVGWYTTEMGWWYAVVYIEVGWYGLVYN